jgi:hypothetical protein
MDPTGVALVIAGAAVALLSGTVLRTKLPAALVLLLLVVGSVVVGAGALLLLEEEPDLTNVVATLLIMAVAGPFHVRVVFGPLGKPA